MSEEFIMKSIFVDTNSVNENSTLCINEIIINSLELHNGEKVIAYQDADSWEAKIVYDDHKWGVVLLTDAKEISKERQEGFLHWRAQEAYNPIFKEERIKMISVWRQHAFEWIIENESEKPFEEYEGDAITGQVFESGMVCRNNEVL